MSQLFVLFLAWTAPILVWAAGDGLLTSEQLETQVQAWVAKKQGYLAKQIAMIPLDHRVKLKNCDREIDYSFPFNNYETVKVVCTQPNWQIFVRVLLPQPGSRSVASTNSSSMSSEDSKNIRQVWVVQHFVSSGSSIQKSQVALLERDQAMVGGAAIDIQSEFTFVEAARDLPPGTVLRQSDLRPMTLIKRGQMVQIMIGPGISNCSSC